VVVLVDGDATYDPSVAPLLVHKIVCDGYDLVNVKRVEVSDAVDEPAAFRTGHRLGNALLTRAQRTLSGIQLEDVLTGYKSMSRRFVTSLPVRSRSFQLEVEIASHAVAMDFAYTEISAPYAARPHGSLSKLSTFRDGFSILRTILRLHRDLRPFAAFTSLAVPWFVLSLALVISPLIEYLNTGKVLRFPSLIVAAASFVVAMLLMTSGWILERTRGVRRDLLLVAANDLERQILLQQRRDVPADGVLGGAAGAAARDDGPVWLDQQGENVRRELRIADEDSETPRSAFGRSV
jgi:hypothetical protein